MVIIIWILIIIIIPNKLIINTSLGDGTEDISCRMEESSLEPDESEPQSGQFNKEESADFFRKLNLHFIQYLVFPRVFMNNPNFQLKMGQIPPIMNPLLSGATLFDTEREASNSFFVFSLILKYSFTEKLSRVEEQRFVVWLTTKFDENAEVWKSQDYWIRWVLQWKTEPNLQETSVFKPFQVYLLMQV